VKVVTEEREVGAFTSIRFKDVGELVITEGAEETLTVEADEQVLPEVITKVESGWLILGTGRTWFERVKQSLVTSLSKHTVTYRVQAKDLDQLEIKGAGRVEVTGLTTDRLVLKLAGAGEVRVEGLAADNLEAELAGAGAIFMSGKVDRQTVLHKGVGAYSALELESREAEVMLKGAGKASVWASENLSAHMKGIGSIEYKGTAKVEKKVSGIGSITAIDS
jgi:hypothetical protein